MRMKESNMKDINIRIILFDIFFNTVCMIFAIYRWKMLLTIGLAASRAADGWRSNRIDCWSDGGFGCIFGNRYSCDDPKKKRSQFFDIGLSVDINYAERTCNIFRRFVVPVFVIVKI